ncbi:hypothetical protein KKG45_08060 [bacterium]|nr:hypothetical protein [bacterium]MBU1073187.1 hypothetical protein [bacterium]MBU1675574.1 hypothetical protein [bacterium]
MKLASKRYLWALPIIALLFGAAQAEVTIDYYDGIAFLDMSTDGTVMAGNTPAYEACIWTEAGGVVPLGMSTTAVFGTGSGSPDISDDGVWVSATILGADSTYTTAGVWSEATGWIEAMPPMPPGGDPMSGYQYGSAWGLSGDGSTLTGLFWYPGQPGGGAHALSWTQAGGAVDIGVDGSTSRANAANYDGSVIVGWDTAPFGYWRPTVWENGVRTILTDTEAFCNAYGVSADGLTVYGVSLDTSIMTRVAAIWRKEGGVWKEELLGALPGTSPDQGQAYLSAATADGRMAVGYSSLYFGESTGIIWTRDTGLVDVEDFLEDNGVTLDPWFDFQSLTCVSADGSIMAGVGQEMVFPFPAKGFIIHTGFTTDVPSVASRVEVERNYPNPFNPATSIPVVLAEGGHARLEVFDAAGRRIKVLHDGELPSGRHEFRWDGMDARGVAAPSGVYLARVSDRAGSVASRSMTLVK